MLEVGSEGGRGNIPSTNVDVVVLSNLLVGVLGDSRGSALDGLRDVVDGLLSGLHCDGLLVWVWLIDW